MEPWLSWGIALMIGGLAFYYYNAQNKPQLSKPRAASVSQATQPATKTSKKRDEAKTKPKTQAVTSSVTAAARPIVEAINETSGISGGESGKKRKGAKKQQTTSQPTVAKAVQPEQNDEEDDADDTKAWAQNLLALKKGTSLAPPSRTDSRNRTVKQSSANLAPTFASTSDADDDLTPALSPALAAGDVSDMLEPTSSGPSVLRLTESSNPAKDKQQRQQATAQAAETKKQRQNKKKVEERKLQREAEERERQVLLENQRRIARESRGEPAKNGLTSSKAPAASEWALRAANRAIQAPTEALSNATSGLLDTFDQQEDQVSQAKKASEDESGWNTVPKGKKQKKRTQPGATDSNESDSGYTPNTSFEPVAAPVSAPAPVKPTAHVPAPVSQPTHATSNGYQSLFTSGYDAGSHPEDSQWSA